MLIINVNSINPSKTQTNEKSNQLFIEPSSLVISQANVASIVAPAYNNTNVSSSVEFTDNSNISKIPLVLNSTNVMHYQ